MTSLIPLATRVEALDGPDREVDALVMAQFYRREERWIGCRDQDDEPVPDNVWVNPRTDRWVTTARDGFEFTRSLDVVVALITEKLPGWSHAYCSQAGKVTGLVGPPGCEEHVAFEVRAKTPALALLAAFLRALASQPDADRAEKESRE